MRVLWAIAIIWFIVLTIVGIALWYASVGERAEAERLAEPLTGIVPGADLRAEAVVAPAQKVETPFFRHSGVAALISIYYVTHDRDSQNKTIHRSSLVESRALGPDTVWLEAGGKRLGLPMKRFESDARSWPYESRDLQELPAELGVRPADVERARANASGSFDGFSVYEYLIQEGTRVYVVARLSQPDPRTGELRLEPDRVLERVETVQGTQASAVAARRSSASGLGLASKIVLGAGCVPLSILILVAVVKRRRGART